MDRNSGVGVGATEEKFMCLCLGYIYTEQKRKRNTMFDIRFQTNHGIYFYTFFQHTRV